MAKKKVEHSEQAALIPETPTSIPPEEVTTGARGEKKDRVSVLWDEMPNATSKQVIAAYEAKYPGETVSEPTVGNIRRAKLAELNGGVLPSGGGSAATGKRRASSSTLDEGEPSLLDLMRVKERLVAEDMDADTLLEEIQRLHTFAESAGGSGSVVRLKKCLDAIKLISGS